MRVDDFSQEGYFWLKDEQNKKFSGTVTVKNGGNSTLKIQVDDYANLKEFQDKFWQQKENIIIYGDCNNKFSVFLDCFIQTVGNNFVLFQIGKSIFDTLPNYDFSKPKFIKFSFDNIYTWVKNNFKVIENEISYENKKVFLEFPIRNDVVLFSNQDFEISVNFLYQTKHNEQINDYTSSIIEKPYIQISILNDNCSNFEFLFEKIYKFIGFILIDAGKISSLTNVQVGYVENYFSPIYYTSSPFISELKDVSKSDFCFGLDSIIKLKENNIDIIKTWFDNFDHLSNSLNLYINKKSAKNVHIDTHFVWLTQALEGFHKLAIDNKKIILKERLEKLFEVTDILEMKLFDIAKIKSLVPNIVKLRNHFIHSNNEFQMGQKLAYNILAFNYLLELIYLLNLLKFLGLNDNHLQGLLTVHIKGYHLQNTKNHTAKFINDYFAMENQNPQNGA
ncbi:MULTISPECIES: HEPN domain-containing protein [Moraxella]|jgi:hypothetical protein|uniref:Uncharacterized protein n=3 Tax=Moraxella TaxID=475 RepID=A0A1B8Q265_MORLA|nr:MULTISPECIES: HEPN domain-containing protein [Moraxella]MBE9588573.1 hypothetical protein [Moraxella sp. K1630]MBE9589960.1 hypothetical protein [Moraxella sp. K127]MBE9596731.1 hypothetical protein [Moraxella sp. K2450]MDH9218202.1 hypothetical protein [Moraxella lacunata]MDI4506772.1 hypothetical protein [Moraxella lacunata]